MVARVAYVEAAAALAQASRQGRLTTRQLNTTLHMLDELWQDIHVQEIDQDLVESAAVCARKFELRGYDAIHCAAAADLNDADLVAAAGDEALLKAWSKLGVASFDTTQNLT